MNEQCNHEQLYKELFNIVHRDRRFTEGGGERKPVLPPRELTPVLF